uniref:HTH_Tnp_Tc3_1 domain-containing protein n=1 Tax=Rhabditophanes sp. KR3021 TaxID=114890 RepID=A0AC35TNN2_9BILA
MGRGKMLTQYEIGQILAFNADGINVSEISRRLNRSRCVISTLIPGPANYGKKSQLEGQNCHLIEQWQYTFN